MAIDVPFSERCEQTDRPGMDRRCLDRHATYIAAAYLVPPGSTTKPALLDRPAARWLPISRRTGSSACRPDRSEGRSAPDYGKRADQRAPESLFPDAWLAASGHEVTASAGRKAPSALTGRTCRSRKPASKAYPAQYAAPGNGQRRHERPGRRPRLLAQARPACRSPTNTGTFHLLAGPGRTTVQLAGRCAPAPWADAPA